MAMSARLLRLFPPPAEEVPLEGLYLGHGLHRRGADRPFVYTNFLTSLDGRISEPDAHGRRRVPEALANDGDWRLYLELLAQAGAVLTSTRHLRAMAAGRLEALLDLAAQDVGLAAWRRSQGLAANPRCVTISRKLDIPPETLCGRPSSPLLVLTCGAAPAQARRALERAGVEVECVSPGEQVAASDALAALWRRGVRSVYSIAGPRMLHTLLRENALDRLYLTLGHRLLGGARFDTLVRGGPLQPAPTLRLHEAYLDHEARQSLFCYAHIGLSARSMLDRADTRGGVAMGMSTTLKRFLDLQRASYELVEHPYTTGSMQTTEAAHIPGDKMAKSVLLEDEHGYLVAVLPATHHLQLGELHRQLGRRLGLATEREVADLFTDCDVGAIPAPAQAYGLNVVWDTRLAELPDVYFEAGDHRALVHMNGEQFRGLMSETPRGRFSSHI